MTDPYIGKVVNATVSRVEHYGLYLSYEDIQIIVLIPDVSVDPVDLLKAWHVGDVARLHIVAYVPTKGLYKGRMIDFPDISNSGGDADVE